MQEYPVLPAAGYQGMIYIQAMSSWPSEAFAAFAVSECSLGQRRAATAMMALCCNLQTSTSGELVQAAGKPCANPNLNTSFIMAALLVDARCLQHVTSTLDSMSVEGMSKTASQVQMQLKNNDFKNRMQV